MIPKLMYNEFKDKQSPEKGELFSKQLNKNF